MDGGSLMQRTLMNDLLAWKTRENRKPLVLKGARQTGKTWLIDEFGRSQFKDVVRIDFMQDEGARTIFDGDLNPRRIVRDVELRAGRPIDPLTTLLAFDEIQEAPRALTSLKYFCEQAREFHVIAAGSYMGLALRRAGESYPVGKVDELTLRPLSFEEFLRAANGDPVADALEAQDLGALERLHDVLAARLRDYLAVGGMPEVAQAFVRSGDYNECRRLQRQIVDGYEADFSKHAPARILERMRLVWKSLPGQLARENKRFVYGAVRPGARARDFEECIQWLVDYGVASKVPRVDALRYPLVGYEDVSSFKLFCVDVGLLGALAGLDQKIVLDGSRLFTEFKGALTEQYVDQQLLAHGHAPVYWSSSTGTAETDFAIEKDGALLPIEVKAAENLKSKSLKVVCEKFSLSRAVRTSLSPYRDEGWLVNIPLWAIGQIDGLA